MTEDRKTMRGGFWRKLAHNKPLNQMIYISAGTLAGIVVLLVSLLSFYYERFICSEIYRNSSARINQATSTVSFLSESVNTLLMQCSQDANINKLFRSENYSSREIYLAKRELDNIRYNDSKIYSIYVYDQYSETIFESCGSSSAFNNAKEAFYDTVFLECLENMEQVSIFRPVVRTIPADVLNGRGDVKVLTYFYCEPYFGSGEKHSIIAVNVSISWLQNALGYFYGANPDASAIEIVEGDGQIVFAQEETLIGEPYGDTAALERILKDNEKYGYFVENGKLITYSWSSYAGYEDWIFIVADDLGDVLGPVRRLVLLAYLAAGAVLLVSVLGLIMAMRRFGVPIDQAFHKARMLEKAQEEKRKEEAQKYLRQLLEGDIEDDSQAIREKFEQFSIRYDFSGSNMLVLISMDDISSLRRKFREKISGCPAQGAGGDKKIF